MKSNARIAVVTSGLGSAFGGIGVVSASIVKALNGTKTSVWRNRLDLPPWHRRPLLLSQAASAALAPVDAVIYEHVDLAQIHELVPWLRSVPYAVFFHGTEVWRPLVGLRRRAIERANLRVSNSQYTASRARAAHPWIPPITPALLGVSKPGGEVKFRGRPPRALLIGRMASCERYKGHEQVLCAWKMIEKSVSDAELVVVGGGDDAPRLRSVAEQLGLRKVKFCGFVSEEEREQLLRSGRVVLLPSLNEGFGLVAAEAAIRGTPVLGIRGTVIEELFEGRGVVLIDRQEPDAIAGAVRPLLEDAERAARLGSEAVERANAALLEEHFIVRFRSAIAGMVT